MPKKEITELERAAIYYGVFHALTIPKIYLLCHPENSELKNLSVASNWINSVRVRPYYDGVLTEYRERKKEKEEKEAREVTPDSIANLVDFTNKAEFIKYLNGAANRIKDDKLKNDILKMLSDHLDFKDESKRDETNQIQRFYLPLRCQDCKLYQGAASKNGTL